MSGCARFNSTRCWPHWANTQSHMHQGAFPCWRALVGFRTCVLAHKLWPAAIKTWPQLLSLSARKSEKVSCSFSLALDPPDWISYFVFEGNWGKNDATSPAGAADDGGETKSKYTHELEMLLLVQTASANLQPALAVRRQTSRFDLSYLS
jgi:hypothetical protein